MSSCSARSKVQVILISQSGGKSTYLLSDGHSYLTSELLINEAVEMTYICLTQNGNI